MDSPENGSYQQQMDIRSPIKKYYKNNEIFNILYDILHLFDWNARCNIFHSDVKPDNIYVDLSVKESDRSCNNEDHDDYEEMALMTKEMEEYINRSLSKFSISKSPDMVDHLEF